MLRKEGESTGREKWRLAAKGVHGGALGANRPGKPSAIQRQLGQRLQMTTVSTDSALLFCRRVVKASQWMKVEWIWG